MNNLEQFAYNISEHLIATTPAEPRESARLFVYHTSSNQVEHLRVADLPRLLPHSLMVVNDTKVLPARLFGKTEDGQGIEMLVLVDLNITKDGMVRALVNKRVHTGDTITVAKQRFVVVEDHEKSMLLHFLSGREKLLQLLNDMGNTPLPPYIKTEVSEAQKRSQYQTIFADEAPSVAAPTASLHFSSTLLKNLKKAKVDMVNTTLQVGLGTFAPIFAENFESKKLHTESFVLPKATALKIKQAKSESRLVVAVGTTVCRTLESAKEAVLKGEGKVGKTDIFIFPPYHFTVPDVLMTNFHVPKSSLMCLVQAFIDDKGGKRSLVDLYNEAIDLNYRFYSYGDAMLIMP